MHLEISVCEIVAIWYGADQLMGPLPITLDKWSAFELEPIYDQNIWDITYVAFINHIISRYTQTWSSLYPTIPKHLGTLGH